MTTKAKYTPGPWSAKQKLDHVTQAGGWVLLYPAQPGRMARLDHDGEFAEANARLIAAAPDLLEAARDVVGNWERGDLATAVRSLAAAIAKAEGR